MTSTPIHVAIFRQVARRVQFKGRTRLAYFLYDPTKREDSYVEMVGRYDEGLIQIDTRSFIEWWIYIFGSFEGGAIDLLKRMVGRESVAIDVGANIGVFTLPLARRVAEVHAFEPHPRLGMRLSENLALNNLRNVTVSNLALSNESGEAVLYGASSSNQGMASLFANDSAEPFTCRLDTLDNYAERIGFDRIDLIKVDVEGAEYRVLFGAQKTLRRFKPAIYVEVNPAYLKRFGSSPQELGELLQGLGYRLWANDAVERQGAGSRGLTPVDDHWPTEQRDHYWLAIHRELQACASGERRTAPCNHVE